MVKQAVVRDWKGKLSPVFYLVPIVMVLRWPWIADAVLVPVALLPDCCSRVDMSEHRYRHGALFKAKKVDSTRSFTFMSAWTASLTNWC